MKQFQEVAPPGFGHTKSDKKKGVEKGGTAAAFDRARKRGDFKGTKSDMFAIMWSQKNKGDKPHYKPGTDKKYKKYEKNEDWKPEIEVIDTKKEAKKREKKRKEAESSLPPHLRLDTMKKAFAHTNESAVLDADTKTDVKKKKKEEELRRLLKHAIAVKRGQAESFEIDKSAHKKVQKKAKLRNLAKGNMNPNEKEAAEKKAGGPKLAFEGWQDKAREAMKRVAGKKKDAPKHDYGRDAGKLAKEKLRKRDHETVNFLDPDA